MKISKRLWIVGGGVLLLAIVAWLALDPLSHLLLSIDLDQDVQVKLEGRVPFHTVLRKTVDVKIDKQVEAAVKIDKRLSIPLDEKIDVPLDVTLDVPIDSDVFVDQVIDVAVEVPIKTVLTPNAATAITKTATADQTIG